MRRSTRFRLEGWYVLAKCTSSQRHKIGSRPRRDTVRLRSGPRKMAAANAASWASLSFCGGWPFGPSLQPGQTLGIGADHRVPERLSLHPGEARRFRPRHPLKRVAIALKPGRHPPAVLPSRQQPQLHRRSIIPNAECPSHSLPISGGENGIRNLRCRKSSASSHFKRFSGIRPSLVSVRSRSPGEGSLGGFGPRNPLNLLRRVGHY